MIVLSGWRARYLYHIFILFFVLVELLLWSEYMLVEAGRGESVFCENERREECVWVRWGAVCAREINACVLFIKKMVW